MNILLRVLAGLLMLVVIAVGGAWLYLDRIVQQAVVRLGPGVTGTEITLQQVNIDLLAGRFGLQQLTVGNPQGYSLPHIFSLGEVQMDLDMRSLRDEVLVIREIRIGQPLIYFEAARSGDNLRSLQSQINMRTRTTARPDESAEPGRKLVIDRLSITGGQVLANHYLLRGQQVSVPLPELTMTGLGRSSNGATLAEVGAQILTFLGQQSARAVANSDRLEQSLRNLQGEATQQLQQRGSDQLEEAGERIGGFLNSLGN